MYETITSDGVTIAPGVVETLVSYAVHEVDGVAQVKAPSISDSLISALSKKHPAQGVIITAEDDGQINIAVHVQVFYGFQLQVIAEQIRAVVIETMEMQVGVTVASVDVFVDGIQFPE
ncbi:MAG: Asp23/Gls24 family envelope stress response protein [Coriobacteriia bacterium]|nr:Asp23/Gls24 family envelope stress response protein [Coriobacteriia bacterium]